MKLLGNPCIYCGTTKDITRDHVPPKNLFPKPPPPDLKTVPACKSCNSGYKKDQDLMMAWLSFGPGGTTAGGKALWSNKLQRSFEKDRGLKKTIAKSFKWVNLHTPSGIYVGRRLATQVDEKRVYNVLEKIVRGLHWIEYNERLPAEVPLAFNMIRETEIIKKYISYTLPGSFGWEDYFSFRFNRVPEHPEVSCWLVVFLNEVVFSVITGSREVLRQSARN